MIGNKRESKENSETRSTHQISGSKGSSNPLSFMSMGKSNDKKENVFEIKDTKIYSMEEGTKSNPY